ncbi:Transposase (putative), YhgA-like protein [Candidatus Magnetomorum sp. HK-1]|nr:Transposase (putative), YhgA-like protein [Candidatus Magnetomorum sp. HK-1]
MDKNQITNPHAMFFENIFLRLDIAADFIKNYLPSDMVKTLDLSTVELERKSFINKQLKGMQSDLLYKLKTIDGKSILIYIFLSDHAVQLAIQDGTLKKRSFSPRFLQRTFIIGRDFILNPYIKKISCPLIHEFY